MNEKTEQFRAEDDLPADALKESAHFLQTLLDAIPSPIFCKDIDGKYKGCNAAFESFIGIDRQELVGKSVYDISPGDLADKYHQMDQTLFRQGGEQVYESSVLYADGTRHDVVFRKAVYRDMNGDTRGLVGVILDISERKQAEESLKKAHALLEGVIESPAGVVIFALDREYRYLSFNRNHRRTMKQIWGADIAIGNSMLDYIGNPDDRAKARENFDRALSGESFTLVEEYGATELERRYFENIYNPIVEDNGDIIGLTLFLTDVTERKRMEDERSRLIAELQDALAKVKTLSGLLPVCASCKKIRNDEGDWERMEVYIRDRSEADFSHSLCPECARKIYPDLVDDE